MYGQKEDKAADEEKLRAMYQFLQCTAAANWCLPENHNASSASPGSQSSCSPTGQITIMHRVGDARRSTQHGPLGACTPMLPHAQKAIERSRNPLAKLTNLADDENSKSHELFRC